MSASSSPTAGSPSEESGEGHHAPSDSLCKTPTGCVESQNERSSSRKSSSNGKQSKTTPKEAPAVVESVKDSPAFSLRPRRSTPKSDGRSALLTSASSSPKYSMFTKNPSLLDSRRFNPQPFEVVKRKLFRFIAKNEGIPCDDDEDFVPIDSADMTIGNSRSKNCPADSEEPTIEESEKYEGSSDRGESISDPSAHGSLLAGYTKVRRHQERKSMPLRPTDSIKSNIDLCIFSRRISTHQITCHLESSSLNTSGEDAAKVSPIYYDKHYLTLKVVRVLKPISVNRIADSRNSCHQDMTQNSNGDNDVKIKSGEVKCESTKASGSNDTSVPVQCLIVLTQEVNLSSPLPHSSHHSSDFDSSKQILPVYFYSEYSRIDIKPNQVLEMTKFVAHLAKESLEENHLQQYLKTSSDSIFDPDDEDSESSNLTIICDDSSDSASPTNTRSKRKRRKVSHGSGSRGSSDDLTPSKNLIKQLSPIRIMIDEYWQSNIINDNCLSLVMDSKVITDPYVSCEITDASFKLIEFEHLDELEVKSSLLKQVKEYQQKSSFAPSVITLSDPRGDSYCNDRINKDHSQIHSRIPFISIKDKIVSIENPLLLKVNSIGKRKETPSPGLRFTSKIIKDEVVEAK